MDTLTISKNGFSFRVSENQDFWKKFEQGSWEPETFRILDRFIKGKPFLDIGAWIGPTSIYGAHLASKVYSFEPDPIAIEKFKNNLSLNPDLSSKVTFVNKAVTPDGGKIKIFSRSGFGDSSSSLLSRGWDSGDSSMVESIKLPEFIQQEEIEEIGLIKMDIEGGEFFLLPSIVNILKKYRPNLYLSLHYPFLIESLEKQFAPNYTVRRFYNLLRRLNMPIMRNKAEQQGYERMKGVVSSLSFYKHIYDEDGREITLNELINSRAFKDVACSVVFTDEKW